MSGKVIVYIACSVDGYIATKNDDLDWLNKIAKEGEDYGYNAFNDSVDTYIVGRRTYDVVTSLCDGQFPPALKHRCYVVTTQERPSENGVTFFSGDLNTLIEDLRTTSKKDIYCDGGGTLIRELLDKSLIDELIISVIPVLLGDGKRLFLPSEVMQNLKLIRSRSYDTGLVQNHYQVIS